MKRPASHGGGGRPTEFAPMYVEPELHRLTGELLRAAGRNAEAKYSFFRAIAVARFLETRALLVTANAGSLSFK